MAALSSKASSNLLWQLEKLRDNEFQTVKDDLNKELLDAGLPEIPWFQLNKASPEDLDAILTTNYDPQVTWKIMFSMFQKISRQDLCKRMEDRRTRNTEKHKKITYRKCIIQWKDRFYLMIHHAFFGEINPSLYCFFERIFDGDGNSNVFMIGDQAAGKTLLLKRMMLMWSEGHMWKQVFSYLVFLSSRDINQTADTSLVELLSEVWPDGQAPVVDILSDPKKLLFVLEDLDNVKPPFSVATSALCSDIRKKVPVSVLVLSLLKRKMASGSSFLISSRSWPDANLGTVGVCAYHITVNIADDQRQKYFELFYKNEARATAAFTFVQENELLVDLCKVPILCWITCTTLNQHLDGNNDIKFAFQTSTDIYAHFLSNELTSGTGEAAAERRRCLLERVCLLALEGLLYNTFDFSNEDLQSVGFTKADLHVLRARKIITQSNKRAGCCMFIHQQVQEFCAAVAYTMPLTIVPLPSVGRELDNRTEYNDFSPVMCYIFGLLNEKTRDILETTFGWQICPENHRRYFVKKIKFLGSNPTAMEYHLPLFHCLFENQEEDFVKHVMKPFVEATVLVEKNKDLVASAYCLKHCCALKTLRFCIRYLFPEQFTLMSKARQIRSLLYWKDFCSLLHTKVLRELEISNSCLDDIFERILTKALMHPNCQLQTLRLAHLTTDVFCEGLLKATPHNKNLKHLILTCMLISPKMVSLLQEVLAHPTSKIQHLSLIKCDVNLSEWRGISSLLSSARNLKKLTLSNNQLSTQVVDILCEALLQSGCALESLVLFYCGLTKAYCSSIGTVLLLNRTLKHLNLSVNYLQDRGVLVLFISLLAHTSQLQELELCGCFFTSYVCQELSKVITSANLRSLELGSNDIGDAGLLLLGEALTHPNCKLQNLGLEECKLTGTSCPVLASVLVRNRTLMKLNLIGNELGEEGTVRLLEALGHPDCLLQTIGLQTNTFSKKTQELLRTVKNKNTHLVFVGKSWAKNKESSKVPEKIGQRYPCPNEKYERNVKWQLVSSQMPKMYRTKKKSTTTS
ncbi:NACHT, LRR and PYD domains-containing protein 11 [Echinops telfairi]|uniref:NACHT, LRR and PYD domains-containing protein 11 n=1 Tax=Echinops telfairi TaxID=9371 RepID=A0AC55D995_ECHTE|nr:NACHT, LRR and PYD domains-containing protein 11 [Echinops telfairi]